MSTTLRHLIAGGVTTVLDFGLAECATNQDVGHPTGAEMVDYYLTALICCIAFSIFILFPAAATLERTISKRKPLSVRITIGLSPIACLAICFAALVVEFSVECPDSIIWSTCLAIGALTIFVLYWAVLWLARIVMPIVTSGQQLGQISLV